MATTQVVKRAAPAPSTRESFARQYLTTVSRCLGALDLDHIGRVIEVLERAWTADAQVFLAGNGGSAATASHMANDLSKTVAGDPADGRRGFRAMALTDNVPLITAWANDARYEDIFAEQLRVLARPGDVLLVISGSGNSPNVVRAVERARELRLTTIGFLGRNGGRLAKCVDCAVVVEEHGYGPIEDVHLALNHLLTGYFQQWVTARQGLRKISSGSSACHEG